MYVNVPRPYARRRTVVQYPVIRCATCGSNLHAHCFRNQRFAEYDCVLGGHGRQGEFRGGQVVLHGELKRYDQCAADCRKPANSACKQGLCRRDCLRLPYLCGAAEHDRDRHDLFVNNGGVRARDWARAWPEYEDVFSIVRVSLEFKDTGIWHEGECVGIHGTVRLLRQAHKHVDALHLGKMQWDTVQAWINGGWKSVNVGAPLPVHHGELHLRADTREEFRPSCLYFVDAEACLKLYAQAIADGMEKKDAAALHIHNHGSFDEFVLDNWVNLLERAPAASRATFRAHGRTPAGHWALFAQDMQRNVEVDHWEALPVADVAKVGDGAAPPPPAPAPGPEAVGRKRPFDEVDPDEDEDDDVIVLDDDDVIVLNKRPVDFPDEKSTSKKRSAVKLAKVMEAARRATGAWRQGPAASEAGTSRRGA